MTKDIYILSGLGADERVFQRLDFSGNRPHFIKWIEPSLGETIESYASRLLPQITSKQPILVGLSFGGIVAVEIARQMDTEKIILIASAKTRQEIPFYFRMAGWFRLHKLVPASMLKSPNYLSNWFFGTTSESEKKILKQILADTDPVFLNWAIDKIVHWKNLEEPKNVIHVHGTADRILPVTIVKSDIKVKDGGHLMTINKASELNEILSKILGE